METSDSICTREEDPDRLLARFFRGLDLGGMNFAEERMTRRIQKISNSYNNNNYNMGFCLNLDDDYLID